MPISGLWDLIPMNNAHSFELMILAISRLLKNGETAATGTLSPIPAAACLLARETHAPALVPLIYGDPEARLTGGLHELFGLAQQGRIDVFFLSGAQIDQQGRINLVVIGDYASPSLRLPGGAGSSMLYALSGRTILFTTGHTKRLFVPRVDFITATAFDEGGTLPWRRGGLSHVVTPLCVMRFDDGEKRLVLERLLPGASYDEVAANTGFDLGIAGDVPFEPEATAAELALLRGPVRERMGAIYPAFVREVWPDP